MTTSPLAAQVLTSSHIEAHNVTFSHTTIATQRDSELRQILRNHVAIGALYNSDERYDPPNCHPQTRTAVLDRIRQWAADTSDGAKPFLWLSGPAGAGKSAIAQTLVETWKEKGVLVVAFFFWRTASERNQKTRLVPTIAFQLMELCPLIRPAIEVAITTMGLLKRSLSFQLEKLVVEPLCSISRDKGPVVIVIDGLDECRTNLPKVEDFPGQDYESQQREILDALATAHSKLPWVRFLIVSRPERQIRESFRKTLLMEQTISLDLKNASRSDADADIRLYLDCKFAEIRWQNGVGASWPTEAQLTKLVQKSSGQFIYPSVAMKHITRPRADPIQSLEDVLELRPGSIDNPLAELDMLYTLVLKSVSLQSLPVVTDILGYILAEVGGTPRNVCHIFAQKPFENSTVMFERFLFLSNGGVNFHLTDLHSVMDIPIDPGHPLRFIHATFYEYLQDRSRSGEFFVSEEYENIRFAQLSMKHLQALDSQTTSIKDYNAYALFACLCAWIDYGCPPSKQLTLYSWSLMKVDIEKYPFTTSHVTANTLSMASKELSTQFTFEMKCRGEHDWRRNLINYLQRCNIPEFEPSWWRRVLVRWRLNADQKRIEEETYDYIFRQ